MEVATANASFTFLSNKPMLISPSSSRTLTPIRPIKSSFRNSISTDFVAPSSAITSSTSHFSGHKLRPPCLNPATFQSSGGKRGVVTMVIPFSRGTAWEQPPPDLASYLYKNRIVYLGMSLVPSVTELMVAEFLYLQYDDETKPIYLYINSTGTTKGGEKLGKNSSQTPPPRPQPPSSIPSPPPLQPSSSPPPSLQPPPPRPSSAPPVQPPSSLPSPPPLQPVPPRSSPPPSSLLSPPPTSSTPPPATSIKQPPPPPPSTRLSPPTPSSIIQLSPPPPPLQNGSENSSPQSGGISSGAILAIAVFGGIIFLGFIGVAIWCFRRQSKKDSSSSNHGYVMPSTLPSSSTESDSSFFKIHAASTPLVSSDVVHTPSDPGGGMGHSRNWFSYEELIKATNGFSTLNLLGEGGFGSVYKGILPDGREIAVKQLKIGGSQGEREFKAEVDIISRIHHRHLVSLVGYCIQDNRKILVYDYVPNNTLYFHLHEEGQPVLEWEKRVKIAAGAARGIAYLHEDCNPRIIHRDIKPSNILLDDNYEARVADFGLAKLAQDANTHVSTRVMGTFGYVAPEYASSGKLTDRSDVYSFGVVLLELITGRMPVDPSQMGDESLVEWARPLLSDALETGEFESLVDPKLGKNYIDSEMFCMIEVAAACVRHSASKRPRMGQVVRAFESLATSDLTNGMRVGESQAFDSAQQSEEIRLFRRMAFGSQNYSSEYFNHSSLRL